MIQISLPPRLNTLFWAMTGEYITCKCLRRLSWTDVNRWKLWSMIGFLVLNKKKWLDLKHCFWRRVGWWRAILVDISWYLSTSHWNRSKWNIRDSASMTHDPSTAVKFKANEKKIVSHWLKIRLRNIYHIQWSKGLIFTVFNQKPEGLDFFFFSDINQFSVLPWAYQLWGFNFSDLRSMDKKRDENLSQGLH